MPLAEGSFDLSSSVPGTLTGTVTYQDLDFTIGGGTLPGGGQFKGLTNAAKITYAIKWTPPVFLDPAPVFTLIPSSDVLFTIPLLAGPAAETGTVLPATDFKFNIPQLGAPSGTALPNVDTAFNIPQVTVTSSAPPELPDLPDTTPGFNIPQLSVAAAPAGVLDFPDSSPAWGSGTKAGDIPTLSVASAPAGVPNLADITNAFNIPDLVALGLVPTAPSGVPDLSDSSEVFVIPGSEVPRALATEWHRLLGAH